MVPDYMAATDLAKVRVRSQSKLPHQRLTTPERDSVVVRKQLSFSVPTLKPCYREYSLISPSFKKSNVLSLHMDSIEGEITLCSMTNIRQLLWSNP